MRKAIKKIFFGTFSFLVLNTLLWILFITNPSLSYADQTSFGNVTVYHNEALDSNVEFVVKDALRLIQSSSLYHDEIQIDLCMNDDKVYPNLHPFIGGPMAYAIFDKTTLKNCFANFESNRAEIVWAVNENEVRHFDLTWLIAHEFVHNLQFDADPFYQLTSAATQLNWKLEGHAEYISRGYKNDNKLKEKFLRFLEEEKGPHVGIPVLELEDGSKQSLSYFKWALLVQYLFEIKGLDYVEMLELEQEPEALISELTEWVQ